MTTWSTKAGPLVTVALCALLGAAPAFTGCVGPTLIVQQYAGPVRPTETIAILRVNGRESVQLVELDDEDVRVPIASDSRLHIEMLPGRHIVSVQNGNDHRSITTVAFEAQAGRVYRVAFAGAARVYEVERGQDAVVRDVTLTDVRQQPAPEPPPPPPPGPQPAPPDAGVVPDAAPVPAASSGAAVSELRGLR